MSVNTLARADAAAVIDRLRPSITAAQRGDQAAFRLLYQEYARSVYNLVFRCVRNPQAAEDVCQEIWVKAFRELPKLHDPQAFPAWLYRIAARACVDAARQNRRLPPTDELPDDRLSNGDDDPERSALRRERVRLTWEAMATMPARQHVALYLREIESLPYKEIAQMLKSSEAAVEMLLFRARRGFAKAYEQLEATTQERCFHARRSMAAILDGEATTVQRNAIRVHVDACSPCNGELTQMRRTAAAYSALLPLPVPALLGERIFESIGAAGASAGAGAAPASIAKVFGLAAVKAKVAALTLVATAATTAATVAAINTPIADEIRPGPSSTHSEILAESQPGAATGSTSDSTATEADAAEHPAAQGPSGPLDPSIPGVTDTVEQLTAPVTSIVDETTADLDAIVDELNGITGEVPAVPPVEIDTPAIPTLPALPLPTPTLPALP